MRKRLLQWVTLLFLTTAALWPLSATAQETGTIQGQVIKGTEGGRSLADLEVTLHIYGADGSEETQTTGTDAQGAFRFPELPTDDTSRFQVTAEYEGVTYRSDTLSLAGGQDLLIAEITVYEATESDATLSIEGAHLVFQFAADGLAVNEMLVVRNDADKTYVGHGPEVAPDKTATLRFPLPPGAELINVGESLMRCCVVPTAEGFVDTMPVYPGRRTVVYAYTLPYQGAAFDLRRAFTYAADSLDIMVETGTVEADIPGFSQLGMVESSGGAYQQWTSSALSAMEQVEIQLQGLPVEQAQGQERDTVAQRAVGLVLVAAAVVLLVTAYPLLRRWRALPDTVEVEVSEAHEALLWRVADLDDAFEAGEIAEQDYEIERAILKRRLLDLGSQAAEIADDDTPSQNRLD